MAGLGETNRKHIQESGVLGSKDVSIYANRDETRHLDIIPSEGTISLHRTGVIAGPKQTVVGVPNTNAAIDKTFELLPLLGIGNNEVATKVPAKPTPYTFVEQADIHLNKATGKVATNVISHGVSLSRQIDGIPVWGPAGVFANYGNEGKLAELSVTWRFIKPQEKCAIPSVTDLIARIRTGKTWIRDEQAEFHYGKLTVKNMQLYYWESDGSEHQSTIYPFAVLDTETGSTDENATIQLFVPLTQN